MRLRREKKIYLNVSDIEAMLGLPEHMNVTHLRIEQDPFRIVIAVESPTFAPVSQDQELEVLGGHVRTTETTVRFMRWEPYGGWVCP